ncbi:hypothetical protein KR018_012084, partial [Drosophila ironensis]
FGKDCTDVACAPGEKCILSRSPCNLPEDKEGQQCGTYPECQAGQLARDFTIDTTLTIANTRSNIIIPTSTSTSTKGDKEFELLTDFGGPAYTAATHAGQRQTNVLVIVQDGSQQSQQPNPWLNRVQSPPCQVSALYPYACNYPGYAVSPGVGLPSYSQARVATGGPQLVPPTPPCYYNCYPARARASPYAQYGYPLARSATPASLTNNYLLYLTMAG